MRSAEGNRLAAGYRVYPKRLYKRASPFLRLDFMLRGMHRTLMRRYSIVTMRRDASARDLIRARSTVPIVWTTGPENHDLRGALETGGEMISALGADLYNSQSYLSMTILVRGKMEPVGSHLNLAFMPKARASHSGTRVLNHSLHGTLTFLHADPYRTARVLWTASHIPPIRAYVDGEANHRLACHFQAPPKSHNRKYDTG
jgi:hypothetical protein